MPNDPKLNDGSKPANPPDDKPDDKPTSPPDDKPDDKVDYKALYEAQLKSQEEYKKSKEAQEKINKEYKEKIAKWEKAFGEVSGKKEEKKTKEQVSLENLLKETMKPFAEKIENLERVISQQHNNKSFADMASNFGIENTPDAQDFFEMKIAQLQEEKGEDISDQEASEILAKVKQHFPAKKTTNKASSVEHNNKKPVELGNVETLDYKGFKSLTMMQKNELFRQNPNRYMDFVKEERKENQNPFQL